MACRNSGLVQSAVTRPLRFLNHTVSGENVDAVPRKVVSGRTVERISLNNEICRHRIRGINCAARPGVACGDASNKIVADDLRKRVERLATHHLAEWNEPRSPATSRKAQERSYCRYDQATDRE